MEIHEQIVREVKEFGNGAHVFTPKNWVGEVVFVVRQKKQQLKDRILELFSKDLESIEGIYLYGSYARGESEEESDIDLLVISNKKLIIKKKNFDVIILEKDKIDDAIKLNPVLIYGILSEAKPIFNEKLLQELRENYEPQFRDFANYLNESREFVKVNRELIEVLKRGNKKVKSGAVPYSLVLRLRGLFVIERVLQGKSYSHLLFKKWTKRSGVDYGSLYLSYKNAKRKDIESLLDADDLMKLAGFLENKVGDLERKYGKKKKTA